MASEDAHARIEAEGQVATHPGRSSRTKRWLVLGAVVLVIAAGVVFASSRGSSANSATAHGTFVISNGNYDVSNEFADPNYQSDGNGGCEGGSGYSDLNATTQVVVKDNVGKELTRTELGEGSDHGSQLSTSGTCIFHFRFTVPEGSPYYVVSVGRRGESKYTFKQLQTPGSIALIIGQN